MDMAADKAGILRNFKFGSKYMNQYIHHFKPMACVFDPVQGFVPPKVNMGSRNEMRDCMAPLIVLGEDVGTTFLVVCHTNKRKGAYGRDRIADSADLWDVARSVIMAGFTETQGVRYLSNEKNNYAQLQETILFSIDDSGQIQQEGTSWKRDKEYMLDATVAKSTPKREDCKDFILSVLKDMPGQYMKSDDLVKKHRNMDIRLRQLRDLVRNSSMSTRLKTIQQAATAKVILFGSSDLSKRKRWSRQNLICYRTNYQYHSNPCRQLEEKEPL